MKKNIPSSHTGALLLSLVLIAFCSSCGDKKEKGNSVPSVATEEVTARPTGFQIEEIELQKVQDTERYNLIAKSKTAVPTEVQAEVRPLNCKEIAFEIPGSTAHDQAVEFRKDDLEFYNLGDGEAFGISIKQTSDEGDKNAVEGMLSIKDTPYPPPGPKRAYVHRAFTEKFSIENIKLTKGENNLFTVHITLAVAAGDITPYAITSIRVVPNMVPQRGSALVVLVSDQGPLDLDFVQSGIDLAQPVITGPFSFCSSGVEINPKYNTTIPIPILVILNAIPVNENDWRDIDFKKGMLWFKLAAEGTDLKAR
jgi:hypothetical protein